MNQNGKQAAAECSLLIIGGGALAAECYAPALLRLGWQRRVEIIDNSEKSVEILGARYPELRVTRCDYREFLSDRNSVARFAGVVIALPNNLHEDSVTRCLRSGLHVLCEKPLALDTETCRRMGAVAAGSGRQLGVAMVRRLIPSVRVTRSVIDQGLLGTVRNIRIEHGGSFHWPTSSGSYFTKDTAGIWVNMGSHYVDMVQSWMGPLSVVEYRDDYRGGVETNCHAVLETSSGAMVDVRLSWTQQLTNKIVIEGSLGEIQAGVEGESITWLPAGLSVKGQLALKEGLRNPRWPPDFISCFAEQFVQFEAVMEDQAAPAVGVADALETHHTIDSGYQQRKPLVPHRHSSSSKVRPALSAAKAVVTGGSGFLGTALVDRLAELGFPEIRVPLRSQQSGATAACFPVSRVLTNLLDYESVREAVRGSRYVFHLAYGTDGIHAARVTIEGTKNIVNAAIETGAEAVVVVSTATVFGHPKTDRPIDESFPYQPVLGEYGASKTAAEKYALEKAKSSGATRIAVINPAAIYGPGGRQFTEFPVRSVQAGHFCWIEEGRGSFNYTFVDNVVDAILLAAQHPGAHGKNFIICDGTCTVREFLTGLIGPVANSLPSYTRAELEGLEKQNAPRLADLARALANDDVMRAVNSISVIASVKNAIVKRLPNLYARLQSARRAPAAVSIPVADSEKKPAGPSWLADLFGVQQIRYSAQRAKDVLGWTPLVSLSEGQAVSNHWLEALGIREEDPLYADLALRG
jgi:predicted dehydrogenase/nucleoside-diphosphate-sugar epimerase